MRTEKEIEEQTKKGLELSKEHPFSMFGTDNVKQYHVFLKVIERYRKNNNLDALEDFVYDAYEDDDLEHASAVVSWLRGEEDIY